VSAGAAAPDAILAVEDIYTAYGLSQVLFGVSIEVKRGECVCLLGRNGVGKTTTMRSIIGLTPPTRGRVVWKGRDVTGRAPYQIARAGIGFIPEDRRIFAELTVWENLDVATRGSRDGGWTVERVFDLFPKLRELVGRQGGFLSGGEQQMLTICRTLMGAPDLIMVDEPTEGLAPKLVALVRELLEKIAAKGVAILLIEQKLTIALNISHRLYVMGHGRIVFEGTPQDLRAHDDVRREWLEV
jgi:branched-chain amino acid transport system ATP-binding protein